MKNVIHHLEKMIAQDLEIEHPGEFKRALTILKCANSALTQMDKPFDHHHIDCSICAEEIKSHKHMQLHVTVTSDKHEFFGVWKEPE